MIPINISNGTPPPLTVLSAENSTAVRLGPPAGHVLPGWDDTFFSSSFRRLLLLFLLMVVPAGRYGIDPRARRCNTVACGPWHASRTPPSHRTCHRCRRIVATMVYLFHFELPVDEATWTCLASVYRPYLKCLTVSEVDSCASAVMHLSRAFDHLNAAEDAGERENDGDGTTGNPDGRPSYPAVTFPSFYYINTKKGIGNYERRA